MVRLEKKGVWSDSTLRSRYMLRRTHRRSRTSSVPLCSLRHGPPHVEVLESRLAPSANVAITTNPGVQEMPTIAVDPHDPDHLVTAYLDYSPLTTGYAGIGVAVSENDGATWQHTSVPLPAPFNQGAATPTVAFNAQGQVFSYYPAGQFPGEPLHGLRCHLGDHVPGWSLDGRQRAQRRQLRRHPNRSTRRRVRWPCHAPTGNFLPRQDAMRS